MRNPNVFLVIKAEGNLSQVNPFRIDDSLRSLAGDGNLRSVKMLRSGELLVETEISGQAQRLLKAKELAGVPIETSVHRALNTCKGVITSDVLSGASEEEILNGLKNESVIHVKRIMTRREGALIPSKSLILTFALRALPTSIKVGYLRCHVRPYIPNPMRCFKCQKYGHSQTACRGRPVCSKCSGTDHDMKDCKEALKCPSCHGPHAAHSRDCEAWKSEKLVQKYKVENK